MFASFLLKLVKFALVLGVLSSSTHQVSGGKPAPEFSPDLYWFDAGHKTGHWLANYRGKVLLVDFWEYTCINCIRELSVLKRWYAMYHPFGLDIVSIHDGEFSIGKDLENVKRATSRLELSWPVAVDVTGAMWRAYGAKGWPTRYLIDPRGGIEMQSLGEGNYDSMEARIRELLAAMNTAANSVRAQRQILQDSCGTSTRETYAGYWGGQGAISNAEAYKEGRPLIYQSHPPISDGHILLTGRWKRNEDAVFSAANAGSDRLTLSYHARSLYVVLSGGSPKHPLRVYVQQDGHTLERTSALRDVAFDSAGSYIDIREPRLYYVLQNPKVEAHELTLLPQDVGVTIHSFTYGNDCQQSFDQL